jgi:hypothetical protein
VNARAWDPDGRAAEALRVVVAEFGDSVLSDDKMLKSSLSDVLPEGTCQREQSLLVAASHVGIAAELKDQVSNGMDTEGAAQLVARRLNEAQPFDASGCLWVARQFAAVLWIPNAGSADRSYQQPPQPYEEPLSEVTVGGGDAAARYRGAEMQQPSDRESTGQVAVRVAVLDPLRRQPTLWLLVLAAVVQAITAPVTDFTLICILMAITFGLIAIAAFWGSAMARTPVVARSGDPAILVTAGVGAVLSGVGWVIQWLTNTGSAAVFDIGVLAQVVGAAVIGGVLLLLAIRYRSYRSGTSQSSPAIPLILGGIGVLLYSVPDIYGATWFRFNPSTAKIYYGVLIGLGAFLIAASLFVTAVVKLGPRVSLVIAGVGSVIYGVTQIHVYYSHVTSGGTYWAVGMWLIAVALGIWAVQVTTGRATMNSGTGSSIGSFAAAGGPVASSRPTGAIPTAAAKRIILIGAGITVAGIVIFFVAYKLTSTRFFLFGPIIVGLLLVYRGVRAWFAASRQGTQPEVAGGPVHSNEPSQPQAGGQEIPQAQGAIPHNGPLHATVGAEPLSQESSASATVSPQDLEQRVAHPTGPPAFCSSCGSARTPEARFCPSCGQAFAGTGQ